MFKVLNKEEKRALIETFDVVKESKDDGTTHQFTKGGWIKFFMKSEYIELTEGGYLEFNKPPIEPEIWYDDEYESPDKNIDIVDVFISHNMHANKPSRIFNNNLAEDDKFALFYKRGNSSYLSYLVDIELYTNESFIKQLLSSGYNQYVLTEKDLEDLKNFYATEDEKYLKRLKAYAKRYPDKLCCRGYWVNR